MRWDPAHYTRYAAERDRPFVELMARVPEVEPRRVVDLGCVVDAWETTYLHVLDPAGTDPDPVFTWVSATGARPTLQALPEGLREEFTVEFRDALRRAYPRSEAGVVLPFRRVFAVARRRDGDDGAGAHTVRA